MARPILRLDTTPPAEKAGVICQLVEAGQIMKCPACGGLSAYAWCDVDEELGVESVGACSAWEWQCGHRSCGTRWVEADSPIMAPCYTHSED